MIPGPDPFARWRARYSACVATSGDTSGEPHVADTSSAQNGKWAAGESKLAHGAPPIGTAALLRGANEATEAFVVPDPDLAAERAETAAGLAAEAAGQHGVPLGPSDHRAVLEGLLAAGLQRPPAWSDPTSLPPPGSWCACCGRFSRTGGRWWREVREPRGWRCWTCHPPDHLPAAEREEVRT